MKKVLLLLMAVLSTSVAMAGYDFSKSYSSNTLYFKITNSTNHEVMVTFPGGSANHAWDGFSQPTARVTIPATVNYNNVTYKVTKIDGNAFKGCKDITNVTIKSNDDSHITIGNNAFNGCTKLKSVNIPKSVTSIGSSAFHGCRSLQSVTIGRNVTTIGSEAFKYCRSLESVTIGRSVTTIGKDAFTGCEKVTTLKYYATNLITDDNWTGTNSSSYGFQPMTNLSVLVIGKNVQTIPNYAFSGRTKLESVTIPDSVTTIGRSAFRDCSGLESVSIGSRVNSIGDYAFQNCTHISSMEMKATTPPNITSSTFSGVDTSHISLIVPDNCITTYRNNSSWSGFSLPEDYYLIFTINGSTSTVKVTGANSVTGEISQSTIRTSITIPESVTYNGTTYPVTSIGDSAFFGYAKLTSVSIPSSVTSIGKKAFFGCTGLTSVSIGSGVTSIGEKAFQGCTGLTSVSIGNSVTSIGYKAFYSCTGLESVTIPNSVTRIDERVFQGCTALTEVTIGSSVSSIGTGAFEGCTDLTYTYYTGTIDGWCGITFGGNLSNPIYYSHRLSLIASNGQPHRVISPTISVNTIKSYAFNNCESLQSVTIGSGVRYIGYNAFKGCSKLTSLTINNGVLKIQNEAFADCDTLESVTFPNSLTDIWGAAFNNCSRLTSVTIPRSVTNIPDNPFAGCTGLTSIAVDGSNTHYNSSNNCNAIIETSSHTLITGCKNTTIPSSVTKIGNQAFYGCSGLTGIAIPSSVTQIGSYAFLDCSNLTSITLPNSVTEIREKAFAGCSGLTSFTIPAGLTSLSSNVFEGSNVDTLYYNARNFSNNQDWYNPSSSYNSYGFRYLNLKALVIGNNVQTIPDGAFYKQKYITSIIIPDSVNSIGEKAFYGDSSLTSVVIGSGVNIIRSRAFYGDSCLTSVVVGSSVTSTNYEAFSNCVKLKTLYNYNYSNTRRGTSFGGMSAKREVPCTRTGTGMNALYQIIPISIVESYTVVDLEESNCSFYQIPKADLPNNFIYKVSGLFSDQWNAKKIVLVDNEDTFNAPVPFTADNATFTRKFTNGNRSTLYLPFSAPVPANFQVFEFDDFDGSTLTFNRIDGTTIAAYHPYLVGYGLAKTDVVTTCPITAQNVLFPRTAADTGAINKGTMTFHGAMAYTEMTSTNHYGYSGGYFVQSNGHAHVKPFRCFFTNTSGSGAPTTIDIDITDDGNVDIDVAEPETEQQQQHSSRYSTDVYDMMGRRVRKNAETLQGLPRGIYIWKGKKELVY